MPKAATTGPYGAVMERCAKHTQSQGYGDVCDIPLETPSAVRSEA
ncbi:hypothetical protein GCM10009798_30440 [Nocardioides panacihumi]|uniref:DUF1059 domain-containing protein n=2 Tax=Nocardioides panacihumi TaxID=400774 RepID=A0ABN2RF42_9ACTN